MPILTTSVVYDRAKNPVGISRRKHQLHDLLPGQLLVKVSAVGLNRADILQRQGTYIPPQGETDVPGVEISGIVVQSGIDCIGTEAGQRVCGVVPGGGFSSFCIMNQNMAMTVPEDWSDLEAGGFAEAALTANEALVQLAGLQKGDTVLIHAASSGMGTMLIKMACHLGLETICTTRSASKAEALRKIGATHVVVCRDADFAKSIHELTRGAGVDAAIDFVAGRYTNETIASVRTGGCIVVAGVLDGPVSSLNWIAVINRRIRILPLTLRMKNEHEKADVASRFYKQWWNGRNYGGLKPTIGRVYPLNDLESAHDEMAANSSFGKIVIDMACGGLANHDV